MTQAFPDVLYLFKCAAFGEEPNLSKEINLQNVYTVSRQQGVWPLVFLSVANEYEKGRITADPKLIEAMREQILISVTKGATRKEILKLILNELRGYGIKAALLKGDTLAELYAYPDYRLSGDIDLLIDIKDEKKIFEVFEKYGFEIEKRMNKEHHSVCCHPAAGTVELHVALYDDYCEEIWFEGKTQIEEEYTTLVTKDGYSYDVLGINDQFIYNVMHMIKHFLSGGAGIRQIMDVLLFIKTYRDRLSFGRYRELISGLGFDSFMDCCMDIGTKYLGFSTEELFYINGGKSAADMSTAVLDDIERCGMFGFNDIDLRDFKMTYLEKKYKKDTGGELEEYMKKRLNFRQKLGLLFIRKDVLARKYPYVKKSPLLVPVAWVHRLFKFVFFHEKLEPDEKKIDTHSQRIALLERLNMV